MMDFESILVRWVHQEEATLYPAHRYVMDLERDAAVELVSQSQTILDAASEVTVLQRLSRHVDLYRVDFGLQAAEKAHTLLNGLIVGNAIVDPRRPVLPFAARSFDCVICIGPLDWKFFDLWAFVDEVRRVTQERGRFVFSALTVNSPYCSARNCRVFRYLNHKDLRDITNIPGFAIEALNMIYQPRIIYSRYFNRLPIALQEILLPPSVLSKLVSKASLFRLAGLCVVSLLKL